jgi:predicted nucleotidyltransferase component of viral defense system
MSYQTPRAFRTALEQRLLTRSRATDISLDRLRRRVVFERLVARLETAEPGRWVIKGGMALEVRLDDKARLTKDLDLGLRDGVASAEDLHERLVDVLGTDPHGDFFVITATLPVQLREDGGGHVTWRLHVTAKLAGTMFGGMQLDISPRAHELTATDRVTLPNSLAFADVPQIEVEIVDVNRHAAEKLHAMTREFGDRDNSRVRDLVDVVLLVEHEMLTPHAVAAAVIGVWAEREQARPPKRMPPLPESWPTRYELSANEHGLDTVAFPDAVVLIDELWHAMFPNEET